ncbi:MAG: pilus assembly protein TadG-related protein [Marinobacter sp.]|uniref:pilus assembly protein TadG-related protein n=1 Tax=Marinobacter sp. TaxID=50741 RepID=UPI002B273286|nr:pilus assembly protein TadG-related protein [Marinobacter sp.]
MNNRNRQKGVLIFLMPFILVAIAVVATLAMDATRLYSVKDDMQSVVNAAATAAADEAMACGVGDVSLMRARALAAAKQAGFDGDNSELELIVGVIDPGDTDTSELKFTETPPNQSNAAVVRYTRKERVSWLLPETFFEPVEISVNAAARKELYATLSANSSTVKVTNGLLGNLLGGVLGQSNYSLDPTSLTSLESTLMGVGDLLSNLGVNNVTALLDRPLIEVLDAVVDVVGGVTTPVGGLVDDLTGAAGLTGLKLSSVLEVKGNKEAARGAEFPLYDFIMSVVLNSAHQIGKASGTGLLGLNIDTADAPALKPLLDNGLLGDLDLTLKLGVDNPAPVVIGPARYGSDNQWMTEIHSSDVSLEALVDLELSIGFIGDLISGLTLGLVQVELLDSIRVPLAVKVGGGRAEFVGASCARGKNNEINIEVLAHPSVASIETGTIQSDGEVAREPIHATILKLALLSQPLLNVCVDADLGVNIPVAEQTHSLTGVPLYCPDGQCAKKLTNSQPTWIQGLDLDIQNLALDCGESNSVLSILNPIIKLLEPVVEVLVNLVTTVLLQGIVSPLLMALGVDLSGLEITMTGADQLSTQLIENVELKN